MASSHQHRETAISWDDCPYQPDRDGNVWMCPSCGRARSGP